MTVSSYLPWLFFLACPLLMMWMMRGMGRSTKDSAPTDSSRVRIAELEREVAELRSGRVHLDKSPRGGSTSRS